jgi:hypothetical protein
VRANDVRRIASVRKTDIMLIVAALAVGAALFFGVDAAKAGGAVVDVEADGRVVASYPLGEDRVVDLTYGGHNRLVISGGTARIEDADCPDRLCVKQGAVSKDGETIVCLPHRVIVKVRGGAVPEVDGVSG